MATWDPKSYIAEVMGASHVTEHESYSGSYYEYTMQLLRRGELSESIEKTLTNEQSQRSVITTPFFNKDFCVSSITMLNESDCEKQFQAVTQRAERDIVESASSFHAFCRALENIYGDIILSVPFSEEKRSSASLAGFQQTQLGKEVYLLWNILNDSAFCELSVNTLLSGTHLHYCSSESTCSVGIRGCAPVEGEVTFVKLVSLGSCGKKAVCQYTFCTQDDSLSCAVAVCGDDILWMFLIMFRLSLCFSCEEVVQCLQRICSFEKMISDFYCDFSDGYTIMRDSLVEKRKEAFKKSSQLYNMNSHLLKAVKTGNTADAFHHLENKHDAELFRRVMGLLERMAKLPTLASCLTSSGEVCCQLLDSFQWMGLSRSQAVVSLQHCSPLYNYLFEKGSNVAITFIAESLLPRLAGNVHWCFVTDACTLSFGDHTVRVPTAVAKNSLFVCVFTTRESFLIGDSAVVIGDISLGWSADDGIKIHDTVYDKCDSFAVTPVLCTMLHTQYGIVGLMGYSCAVGSHFPPSLILCAPFHTVGMPLDEKNIDPTFTLYFFPKNSSLFSGNTLGSFVDDLPFSLSLTQRFESQLAFSYKLRCRLNQIIPQENSSTVLLLLSVTTIDEFGSDIFCVSVDQ